MVVCFHLLIFYGPTVSSTLPATNGNYIHLLVFHSPTVSITLSATSGWFFFHILVFYNPTVSSTLPATSCSYIHLLQRCSIVSLFLLFSCQIC